MASNLAEKRLQSYLRLLSVSRRQYGRKCLRVSTANRYQPLSVCDCSKGTARWLVPPHLFFNGGESGAALLKDGGHF